jgi:hypothetical protein
MAADEQSAIGFTAQCRPEISRRVGMNFNRKASQFFLQPVAGGEPRFGERDALGSVLIAGELTELFEFGNGALRVEGRAHAGLIMAGNGLISNKTKRWVMTNDK